jgi:hypothetical protein
LRINGEPAEGTGRQVVSLTWQAVARGRYALLNAVLPDSSLSVINCLSVINGLPGIVVYFNHLRDHLTSTAAGNAAGRPARAERPACHVNLFPGGSVAVSGALLATLAARFRRAVPVLGEVAAIVVGPAAPVAIFAALASRFGGPLTIACEVTLTVLPASLTGSLSLFAIVREVARIPSMSLFGHW